jgi:hypothetical protein
LILMLLLILCACRGFAQSPHIIYISSSGAGSGSAVQIHGTGLTGVTAVHFGGVNAQSYSISQDTMINAIVGSGASGYVSVWGPGGTDSVGGFTYFPTVPTPSVNSFLPASGGPGAVITLRGVRFSLAASVRFGGTPAANFTILSDTVIQATVGYGTTGFVSVYDANGGGGGVNGFIYLPPPGPTHISYFSPVLARPGDLVQIHGVSFTGVTGVRFGGVSAQSFTVASDTLIQATVGAGASGRLWVSGSQGMDSLAGFVFIDTSTGPRVYTLLSSFAPASAASGAIVQLHGSGFATVNTVRFGGVPALDFTILSDSLINAQVGSGASGLVFVSGPHGGDSLPGFQFIRPKPSFQLVSLTVTANGGHPQLQWQTLADEGIVAYEPQHALDSTHFSSVGVVASMRLDTAMYSFTDSVARSGMNFYRLRYLDTTGRVDSSYLVAVVVSGATPTLTGFPNPAVGRLYVPLTPAPQTSTITVSDMDGRVMMTVIVPPNSGSSQLDLSHLLKGVYKVVWSDGTKSRYQTILVWR